MQNTEQTYAQRLPLKKFVYLPQHVHIWVFVHMENDTNELNILKFKL